MRKLFIFLLVTISIHAQKKIKEFEGIIKYNHKVIAKESSYDINYDLSAIGKSSEYYYRNGDYKFVNHNSSFKGDLFKSKELTNYLILEKSDTVLVLDSRIADFRIVEFEIKKSVETILGQVCDELILKLKPLDKENPISYRKYYFSNQLPIDSNHFKFCQGNGYEIIYEKMKQLPLKIEFEWPDRSIIWEAYDIIAQKLSEDIFEKESNWKYQKIN